MSLRLEFVETAARGIYTMTELCARYGISRRVGYKGVLAALTLALALWRHSPRALRWLTLAVARASVLVHVAGYGVG